MLSKSYNKLSDSEQQVEEANEASSFMPPPKKSRTNTPWTSVEEQRLKVMRDAGSSWGEISKTFPNRSEGSVKKHWYKDMHYDDFTEDDSAALRAAIKEYEASKWKVIGEKVGKPASACEKYAKENFGGKETKHPLEAKSLSPLKLRETNFKEPFVAPTALEHPDLGSSDANLPNSGVTDSTVLDLLDSKLELGSRPQGHIRTPSDIMVERRNRESRRQRHVRAPSVVEVIKAKREDLESRQPNLLEYEIQIRDHDSGLPDEISAWSEDYGFTEHLRPPGSSSNLQDPIMSSEPDGGEIHARTQAPRANAIPFTISSPADKSGFELLSALDRDSPWYPDRDQTLGRGNFFPSLAGSDIANHKAAEKAVRSVPKRRFERVYEASVASKDAYPFDDLWNTFNQDDSMIAPIYPETIMNDESIAEASNGDCSAPRAEQIDSQSPELTNTTVAAVKTKRSFTLKARGRMNNRCSTCRTLRVPCDGQRPSCQRYIGANAKYNSGGYYPQVFHRPKQQEVTSITTPKIPKNLLALKNPGQQGITSQIEHLPYSFEAQSPNRSIPSPKIASLELAANTFPAVSGASDGSFISLLPESVEGLILNPEKGPSTIKPRTIMPSTSMPPRMTGDEGIEKKFKLNVVDSASEGKVNDISGRRDSLLSAGDYNRFSRNFTETEEQQATFSSSFNLWPISLGSSTTAYANLENASRSSTVPIVDEVDLIMSEVLNGLSLEAPKASLTMQWDLLTFMETEFDDNDDANLASVITFSGTVQYAQATTCLEYANQTWPSQGSTVIAAFQSAIDSREHKSEAMNTDTNIEIDLRHGVCILEVRSKNPRSIAEILQQAIWMGAAMRISKDKQIQYSNFRLAAFGAHTLLRSIFSVKYDTSELSKDEQSCWLPLLTNPVIARGFPVPERENREQGLEVPLEIMAALGGARHVTEFEGGLVLKGHSAMFVPIKRHHRSIQWHLIWRSDEQRILYRELRNECPKRAMLEDVDHESLKTTRTFLGWWKSSETHLGTGDAAYDRIDWSPAGEARRPTRFSGANIGFQTMITGQLNFIMGAKDGRLHFSQKGPFQRIFQCAGKTPVVLYDLEDHRAWLVPALDVMLHVVQTRHHLSPYRIGGGDIELTPVNPKNGRGAATEAVAANQLQQLYERDVAAEKGYYFKDAMLDIWSQMERLMEKDDSIEAYPGLALHGTMRSKVHGWEYMSLVHEKNYRRKEATIAKSSGGWVDLINDVDALVLFATGFDEIIRPVTDLSKLCARWRNLPKGKDYLAAGIPILELLYSEAGSRLSHKHLTTSHLQWQRGSTLFEQCSYAAPDRCECDRTQQIYHDSLFKTFGRVRPPGDLEANGCAIFGQARHSFRPLKKVAIRQNAVHVLPNTSIQDDEKIKHVSQKDDGLLSPSLPASVSQEPEEVNGFAIRSPKRPPSPLSLTDNLAQEKAVAPKRMRRMSYIQISKSDTCDRTDKSNDQLSLLDDCAVCPAEYRSRLKHNIQFKGQDVASPQTARASEADHSPLYAQRTMRRKAMIEDNSHARGCSCTNCSVGDFEPPGSIEFVDTTTDARGNATKLVERRERQAV